MFDIRDRYTTRDGRVAFLVRATQGAYLADVPNPVTDRYTREQLMAICGGRSIVCESIPMPPDLRETHGRLIAVVRAKESKGPINRVASGISGSTIRGTVLLCDLSLLPA